MSNVAPSPEQGQFVSVRSRNWIVTEVARSTLSTERLQTGYEAPHQFLILSSVEDDALGEELQVIPELESAAKVVRSLPSPIRLASTRRISSTLSWTPCAGAPPRPPTFATFRLRSVMAWKGTCGGDDREAEQGNVVVFPKGVKGIKRTAFGRSGKGRHAPFCFKSLTEPIVQYGRETARAGRAAL